MNHAVRAALSVAFLFCFAASCLAPAPPKPSFRNLSALEERLRTNLNGAAAFQSFLAERKALLGRNPVIQVGNIRNKTTDHEMPLRIAGLRMHLRGGLVSAGSMTVVDDHGARDSQAGEIVESIEANAGLGLRDNANVQAFGTHLSPDLTLRGTLSSYDGGDVCELLLEIVDLSTGSIVWQDWSQLGL
ncbi:MAG: hypothetical protein IJV65_02465 [Kiritimatiellae bacterium]|nr:hypothetical protein [Kiritimatiellia bacterium]